MKRIFYLPNTELSCGFDFRSHLAPATGKGTMNRADLVAAKSHDFPPGVVEAGGLVTACEECRILRTVFPCIVEMMDGRLD
jgi:hypothetical protein